MDNVSRTLASERSGQSARRAITHYARAAAYEENCGESNSAGQMWFVVRALCNEHGVNYNEQIRFARQFAYDALNER